MLTPVGLSTSYLLTTPTCTTFSRKFIESDQKILYCPALTETLRCRDKRGCLRDGGNTGRRRVVTLCTCSGVVVVTVATSTDSVSFSLPTESQVLCPVFTTEIQRIILAAHLVNFSYIYSFGKSVLPRPKVK